MHGRASDTAKWLLTELQPPELRAEFVGLKTSEGYTPLHAACWAGDAELLRMLIDAGGGGWVKWILDNE